MTFRKWRQLYKSYQSCFDIELTLTAKKIRYSDLDGHRSNNGIVDDVIYFD